MTDPILPPNSTSIFLFSAHDQLARDRSGLPRQSYAAADGAKAVYTTEIPITEEAAAKIADYQKLHPDARIVGYGTKDTERLYSPPPRLALSLSQ